MTTAALKSNYDLALAGPVGSLDSYIQAVGGILPRDTPVTAYP